MTTPRAWRAVLGALLVAAAAVFLALTVARNWEQLEAFDWRVRWWELGASVVALTAVLGWGVFVWKRVLDRFEHPPVRVATLMRIWFASNLARYIPGKIWQFVGAAELARAAGLSRVVVLSSMVVHVGFSLLAAAVAAALALLFSDALPFPSAALAAVAAASVPLVHPALINAALRLVPRALHDEVLRWNGSWSDGLALLGLSLVSWALYGAAFALFIDAIVPLTPAAIIPLVAVNALSFVAGYLVFVAPAGLGAREGVMAVLLRPFAPIGIAAVVAMLSRLWTIAAELLGAALVLALTGRGGDPRRSAAATAEERGPAR